FLSDTQVLNLFIIGVGNVGQSLLNQIHHQQEKLKKDKSLELRVVGIANSRKCVFSREGIDIANYKEILEKSELKCSPAVVRDEILKMNIFNSVFVDCTASPAVASIYAELLDHNVNVVAANKVAASSDYSTYRELKQIAYHRDVKFLFETNVGAGLPIISTINALINSGDEILRIEAVVSGTLNYIFNVLSANTSLSQAITQAKELGYSEPDPRIDLSGIDVVRKIVILARESGYCVEQSDVKRTDIIPPSYFDGNANGFIERVSAIDDEFEKKRKSLEQQGKSLRFVARLEDGQVSVGLEEIDSSHPFYRLEGSNNIILLTTSRYKIYPMEIKGYGAGAEVTAAGVFADIISIANIR
ncbi:MAG: bifunctional aspartate kinase/homoserine dehydrogenase I, partial [Bacteroidaceae bacterium]|nr:bifunctional aspartate kinase/homoserine dehydrogenase I [Bacteroidaceae bacterium]